MVGALVVVSEVTALDVCVVKLVDGGIVGVRDWGWSGSEAVSGGVRWVEESLVVVSSGL